MNKTWRLVRLLWKLGAILAVFNVVALGSAIGWAQELGVFTLTIYGVIAVARKALQLIFARKHNKRARVLTRTPIVNVLLSLGVLDERQAKRAIYKRAKFDDWRKWMWKKYHLNTSDWHQVIDASRLAENRLTSGVVVPIYGTSEEELRRLVQALVDQTYPPEYVVLALNDAKDEKMKVLIPQLIEEYASSGIHFKYILASTKGKRNAMEAGFSFLLSRKVDIAFNIDSDSAIDIDAISNGVRVFEAKPNVHCLTGDIRVSNPRVNLLTILTYQRYHIAFNLERAAQALFDAVTCMSGPFLAIRAETLRLILEPWYKQEFLGKPCNYGDDRHISTLTLKLGLGSWFTPESISWTDVPSSFKVWRVQQTRWSRSFWRETIITLPWISKLPAWVIFDIVYQTLFPFVLFGILTSLGIRTATIAFSVGLSAAGLSILPYLIVIFMLVQIFHGLYGALTNRDLLYLLNPLYLLYHFFVLEFIRAYALPTLGNTGWGTK